MRKRVGGYVRLSDEDRNKLNKTDESESIQNQKNMLIKYCEENDFELIDIYCDEDYSGAGTYRPDFERLINDCENGKLDIVLCKSQSRFSRDMEVIERYLHNRFMEWNIRFIGIVDNVDTDNKGNKKSRQINGLVNEWYLEDLSENIKKTIRNKKESGQFTGSFAPFGYIRSPEDKHKLIIDEVASEVVKTIFDLYKSGKGYMAIVKYLNEKEIPSPYDYKRQNGSNFKMNRVVGTPRWHTDTIAKILKDETYIGNLVQGKTRHISYKNKKSVRVPKEEWIIVKDTHEPIIDIDTWLIVGARFLGREKPQNSGEIHMFSQKVYCDICGKIFQRNTGRTKTRKLYYLECKSRKQAHIDCDNKKSMRLDSLEELVKNEINNQLELYYNQDTLDNLNAKQNNINMSETYNSKIDTLKNEKNSLEINLEKKNEYYQKLYEDKIDNVISENEFKTLRERYNVDIDKINTRIKCINEEIHLLEQKIMNVENKVNIFEKYKHIEELNKVIIDEFVDVIKIGKYNEETNEREIIIEWDFLKV